MMMIEKVTCIDFIKDKEITYLKPQNPASPVITMDVPFPSASPHTTRSGTTAPPPATSSSSSGSILRVLKSMFAWCRDTRQCQDVILSNQCHQNEKMGIDEFDEFPLHVPPLDDNPFASLFTADLAAPLPLMMAASTRMMERTTRMTMSDDLFGDHVPSFPFLVS
jgi:hypothetical protein